mmetsp:Transcript_12097/g.18567  ORF Transcript_12097/g.18567 Transcript_12097/m.18567 type:complete len:434 (+) Transcript_12097:118-1419(+)
MDNLSPSFHSDLRRSPLLVAVFNLVATIVGGGVLSLPLAFSKCGIILATLLMIFAAIITDRSLYLLCITARKTGATSYGQVGNDAFGEWMDWFISGLLVVFLVFVLTAYMVLLKDIWTPLLQLLVTVEVDGSIVLLGIVLIMTPFMVQRTLHTLRFNCYIGFGAVSILCLALLHHGLSALPTSLKLFPDSIRDVLFSFPIIMLSFLSTFNVLPIQNALIRPSRIRMHWVVTIAVTICFLLMYLFGIGGYLFAKETTQGNILLNCNHEEDWMFLVGRLGCGTTIMLALAMMMLPCRENFLELTDIILLNLAKQEQQTIVIGEQTELLPSSSSSASQLTRKVTKSNWWHYGSTFGILTVSYFGAIMAPGVAVVWSLCGSSMAFLIAFILPGACWIQIQRKEQDCTFDIWTLFAWFLIIFSFVGAIFCTWNTFVML